MFRKICDEDVQKFLKSIEDEPYVSLDTETHFNPNRKDAVIRFIKDSRGVLHPNNEPFLLTISTKADNGFAIDFNDTTLPHIKQFIERDQTKILANASFDLHMLMNMGIEPQGEIVDVLIMHNLINEEDVDENGKYLYGLDAFAAKYLGATSDEYTKQLLEKRKTLASERDISYHDIDYKELYDLYPEIMIPYACADTRNTLGLYELWLPKIYAEDLEFVYNLEMDNIPVVTRIERNGHAVDMHQVELAESELNAQLNELQDAINTLAGKEVNVNSTNEIVECFISFGFDYTKKSDKGNWIADKNILQTLTHHKNEQVAELSKLILEYRNVAKTLNTYMQELKNYTQPTGKIHCNYWQAGTRTGRFSSSDPNLQNISDKNDYVRRCFVPSEDYMLVYFDYSQQEYRMLAHHAEELGLINMIEHGYDVHRATAALLWGKPSDEVTSEERQRAKTINFSLVYGTGNAAFARGLGFNIDVDTYNAGMQGVICGKLGYKPWAIPTPKSVLGQLEILGTSEIEVMQAMYVYEPEVLEAISHAQSIKRDYFDRLPNIKKFIYDTRKECQKNGYIRTWSGRKKRYNNPNKEAYKAVNAMIQGGCGDILKVKLLELDAFLRGKKSRIVNIIHDEIVTEIHLSETDLISEIQSILTVEGFKVRIDCDVEYSVTNWAEKKSYVA